MLQKLSHVYTRKNISVFAEHSKNSMEIFFIFISAFSNDENGEEKYKIFISSTDRLSSSKSEGEGTEGENGWITGRIMRRKKVGENGWR